MHILSFLNGLKSIPAIVARSLLATQSIEARAQQEGRVQACTIGSL